MIALTTNPWPGVDASGAVQINGDRAEAIAPGSDATFDRGALNTHAGTMGGGAQLRFGLAPDR